MLLAESRANRARSRLGETRFGGLAAQQRLLDASCNRSTARFDLIVVDAGRGLTPWTRRFWLRAKLVLLVTTPDDAAVLDAYAAIEAERRRTRCSCRCRLLVNQCDQRRGRRRMRIGGCRMLASGFCRDRCRHCRRCRVHDSDALLAQCVRRAFGKMPNSPFGHAVLWLGRAVSDVLEMRGCGDCGREQCDVSETALAASTRLPHRACVKHATDRDCDK